MNIDEVRELKKAINRRLDVKGRCNILSVAAGKLDKCECALCQIDDMCSQDLWAEVNIILNKKRVQDD